MGCAFGVMAHGSLLTRRLFVTQGFAWGDAGHLFGQDGVQEGIPASFYLSNWPLALVKYAWIATKYVANLMQICLLFEQFP
jgi:hypothetical protein